MNDENPYSAPTSDPGRKQSAAEASSQGQRLSAQQAQWLVQSQYAIRVPYVMIGLFVLFSAFQLFFTLVFLGKDAEFGVTDEVRNHTIFVNGLRMAVGVWIALSLHRLDRAVGHVVEHDAAPATLNRVIRFSRNAWIALAGGVVAMVLFAAFYSLLRPR